MPRIETPDPPAAWLALTATERGAAHVASGLPNQDAVAAYPIAGGAVAAVADGHGHRRHFRSDRGSRLAVAVAGDAAPELTARLDGLSASQIEAEAQAFLVPALAGRWRAAVAQDIVDDPLTAAEEASQAATGDTAVIAYGSTLLLAVAWRHWLVLAQIGDGDIVAVQPDGAALLPVPIDPSLDGRQTTSLCEPRATDEFRVAVVDTSRTPLRAVMLATDGYGNAQPAHPWAGAFSADLAGMLAEHDPEWLASQLPRWAERSAGRDGSGDDTTIALLLGPASAAPGEPGPRHAAGRALPFWRRRDQPGDQPR
jgi:Protein phosphatase 2C